MDQPSDQPLTQPQDAAGRRRTLTPVRIVLGLGFILVVAIAATTALIVRDRFQREVASAGREMQTLATVLGEETSRSLQSVHLVLRSVVDQVRAQNVDSPEQYEAVMSGRIVHEQLRARLSGVPQLDALTVIRADGKLINFSRTWPIPPVNVSDRDYFIALRGTVTDTPFLSEPVQNRGTGTWTIYLAQRIGGSDGRFIGLVLAAIELTHFERLYSALDIGPGASITLWRRDGTLLARYPAVPAGQRRPVSTNVPEARDRLFETSRSLEGMEPTTRLIASRRLVDYPVEVNVARMKSEILQPWRRDLVLVLAAAGLCILSVIAAVWATIRQFRHYEALVLATAEREQAVLAREETERQLMQVQKLEAVGQLTAGVAHDFNNLLTVILGGTDLGRRLVQGHPRLERIFENIARAAERGASLTAHLLSFARKQALTNATIDVGQHVATVVRLLRRSVHAEIGIEGDVPNGIWQVEADEGQLQLALLNIGLNARDAMPDGGVIRFSAENRRLVGPDQPLQGDFVAISVRDTGSGIRPEIIHRVFEPFFSTKDVGKGSGLGLSQAYGFASQSGGTITIDSTIGAGTIVTLILPARKNAAPAPLSSARREPVARGSSRILLVEDEVSVADMVADALRDVGYEVVAAHDAVSALHQLEEQGPFALMFSDVTMPGGMNGIELAQHVRAQHPELPVLLTTGYSDSISEVTTREFPLMRKPYELTELRRQIEACIKGQE